MIDDMLALLEEMNEAGRIEYDDYRALHDAVSVIALPAAATSAAVVIPRCQHEGCGDTITRSEPPATGWEHMLTAHGVKFDHEATPPVAATGEEVDRG